MPIERQWYEQDKMEIEEHVCDARKKISGYENEVIISRKTKPSKTQWEIYFSSDGFWNFNAAYCPFCGVKLPD